MFHDVSSVRVRRAASLIVRDTGDDLLVLGPKDDAVKSVTGPAADLIRRAALGRTVEDLIADPPAGSTGIRPADRSSNHATFAVVAQLIGAGWLEEVEEEASVGASGALDAGAERPNLGMLDDESVVRSIVSLLPPVTHNGEAWLQQVVDDRITIVAAHIARRRPELVPADSNEALQLAARDRIAWSMLVERSGVNAVQALCEHGVDCLVLKGLVTAHLDYPDPVLRELGDADLLVRAGDVRAADAALRDIAPRREEVSDGLRLRNKELNLWSQFDVELDLHHRLLEDPFGRAVRIEELFESSVRAVVGGVPVSALGPAHRLAHSVAHWSSSPPASRRGSGLVDVIVQSRAPEVVDGARDALSRWSLGCLADAVPLLPGRARPDRSPGVGSLMRRAQHGSRLAAELAAIAAEPTMRERWVATRDRIHPSDELMALHGVSRTHRLVRFAARTITPGRQ